MKLKQAPRGLIIEVGDVDWNAYGAHTMRNRWLYKLLVQQGGVSDSVGPGTYLFDAKFRGFKLVLSLLPYKD